MRNFLICFIIGFILISCNKDNNNNADVPRFLSINVIIKKEGVFSDVRIENPSNTVRLNPTKYKVVYEELDDVGVKIMHINEMIGKYIYFQIYPYGSNMDKNNELIKNHIQRKFRLTLYDKDKVLLSKVITVAAEKWWVYRELKVDNMDYVENLNKSNSNAALIFNLSMKNKPKN